MRKDNGFSLNGYSVWPILFLTICLGISCRCGERTDQTPEPSGGWIQSIVKAINPYTIKKSPEDRWLMVDHLSKVTFVLIPAGTYVMGSPKSENGHSFDERQHRVILTKPFWLGQTEITQSQWNHFMVGSKTPEWMKGDNLPVTCVSWNECQKYIKKLNAALGKELYRLPTEAEWEYACKAGAERLNYDDLNADAWYLENSGRKPHPVGLKKPNAWGLYDMLGNVFEWCADGWQEFSEDVYIDPIGQQTSRDRIEKGGDYNLKENSVRASMRASCFISLGHPGLGFRLARSYNEEVR